MDSFVDDFDKKLSDLYPPLQKYAARLTHRYQEVDDLVQVTMEKAWRSRNTAAQFQNRSSLSTWAHVIMRNSFLMQREKEGARIMLTIDECDLVCGGESDYIEKVFCTQVIMMIHYLDQDRQDVMLGFVEEGGRTGAYRALAEKLHLPMNTVKTRLFRGREQLRKMLGGNPHDCTGTWIPLDASPLPM